MRRTGLIVCISVLAPAPFAVAKNSSAVAPLVRPATPPDDDAKGRVEMSEKGKGKIKFSVKAQRIGGVALELFMEDAVGSGVFVSAGPMVGDLEDPESASLKFDGSALPLGVASLADLVGRRMEVRDATPSVFLEGAVPDFAAKKSKGGWLKGKRSVIRPDTPPDEDAKGVVELRTKAKQNRDRFVVHAQHLPTETLTFSVFMEDALGSGVFVEVGAMDADLEDPGSAKLKIDTWQGAPLPHGVSSVSELAGFALEIRGSDLATYLGCMVPEYATSKKKLFKGKANMSGDAGSGKCEVRSHVMAPDERLTLKGEVASLADLEVFMESPDDGLMALVGAMPADSGSVKFKVSTKSGEPLPFGACTVAELEGLAVEVREAGGGAVLLSGVVPGL